jgi:hypothetical protein
VPCLLRSMCADSSGGVGRYVVVDASAAFGGMNKTPVWCGNMTTQPIPSP